MIQESAQIFFHAESDCRIVAAGRDLATSQGEGDAPWAWQSVVFRNKTGLTQA